MKIYMQRFSAGFVSCVLTLGLVCYGVQPVIARAESVPVTSSDTLPTDTTTSTPSDTSTTSSTPTDNTTTSSDTTTSDPATSTVPNDTSTPLPSTTSVPGPQKPTGDSSSTYIYNEATGKWENDYYIWDPITKQTSPKIPVNYSYNPSTGKWDTTEWIFNAAAGKYVPNVISIAGPPAGAVGMPLANGDQPLAISTLLAPMAVLGPDYNTTPLTTSGLLNGSNNNGSKTAGIFDLFYNASISNNIDSQATTGDASVSGNTTAGNATTGDATSVVNLLNMINSSWGLATPNPLMFVANVMGNVLGDILINPLKLLGSQNNTNSSTDTKVTVNSTANSAINNNVNLGANSGDALVQLNTKAGDATTGNATVMANVMNLLNTSIGTGQSFLGAINIYGNLNGDILLPPGVLDSLLASNAQPNTVVNNTGNNNVTSLNANLDNNTTINNNINATATSGTAAVANNTIAGNATTGNANTNVTLLNFTGRQVVGKDALLVFVNVLGKWVGMIFNAPNGATSGALGGGITQNSVINTNTSANFNATTNNTINNTINAHATSGNALVDSNTTAGNATSGNATTGVNVLNIANSSFNLSDWFGILFINVFGNWYGSFGVDTAAGNPVNTPNVVSAASSTFGFVPKVSTSYRSNSNNYGASETTVSNDSSNTNGVVLGASIGKPLGPTTVIPVKPGFGFVQYAMFAMLLITFIATAYYWYATRTPRQIKIA